MLFVRHSPIKSLIRRIRSSFYYLIKLTTGWVFVEKLLVIDLRTCLPYTIPIRHNAIPATEFRKISPLSIAASFHDRLATGLTILDAGFRNTAVGESRITYMYKPEALSKPIVVHLV